jgi:hypothetical protein
LPRTSFTSNERFFCQASLQKVTYQLSKVVRDFVTFLSGSDIVTNISCTLCSSVWIDAVLSR